MRVMALFTGLCAFLWVLSAAAGVWTFVGNITQDNELRGLISMILTLLLGWGQNYFEKKGKDIM
jgi:hypothetical protein